MKFSRPPRDALLAIGLVFILAILTAAAARQEAGELSLPPLESASSAPDGARALYLWVEALGYPVSDAVGAGFAVPEDAGVVVSLEPDPAVAFSRSDLEQLGEWVRAGGTLIYAAEGLSAGDVPAYFGFPRRFKSAVAGEIAPVLPLLLAPPQEEPISLNAAAYFAPEVDDFIPIAALPEGPVVVVRPYGEGQVILSAATRPFTNAGLKEPANATFLLNLIRANPAGTRVWFDEWHHGRRALEAAPGGPGGWLRGAPAGRAILFSALAIFIWIALSGRAFGRALPVGAEAARRAPLEFVTAIASLNQQAGNRAHLARHYHQQIKRRFSRRFRIDPGLPDSSFLEELKRYDPPEDVDSLARLLCALRDPKIGESELIRLAAEAAGWLE